MIVKMYHKAVFNALLFVEKFSKRYKNCRVLEYLTREIVPGTLPHPFAHYGRILMGHRAHDLSDPVGPSRENTK